MGMYAESVLVLKHECGMVSDKFPISGIEVFTDEYIAVFDRIGNAIIAAGARADNSHVHIFKDGPIFLTGVNTSPPNAKILEGLGIYVTNL